MSKSNVLKRAKIQKAVTDALEKLKEWKMFPRFGATVEVHGDPRMTLLVVVTFKSIPPEFVKDNWTIKDYKTDVALLVEKAVLEKATQAVTEVTNRLTDAVKVSWYADCLIPYIDRVKKSVKSTTQKEGASQDEQAADQGTGKNPQADGRPDGPRL